MRHFFIGGDGCVGTAVTREAERQGLDFFASSRRLTGMRNGTFYLDLLHPFAHQETGFRDLPHADVVYLIASMPTFESAERDRDSWAVNVDGVIAVAKHYAKTISRAHVVYVSSDAVEWIGGAALARQKAQVESFMHTIGGAIMRPTKIKTPEEMVGFVKALIAVGSRQVEGVHRWRR